jgi:prepilin-type N-terminal cleavage/methylation domain-containing protein
MGAGVLMRRARTRVGFSLIEVMVALVILTIVVAGLAATTVTFQHQMTLGTGQARATAAAISQMSIVRSEPDYNQLSNYAGVQSNYPQPGYTVTTVVNRDTSVVTGCTFPPCPNNDLTQVAVTVTAPGLTTPVMASYSIAP